MRFLSCIFLVLFLLPKAGFAAAPMTVKDVALMIRMGVTETDVITEVEKRRLLAPIDATGETTLRTSGATPALIGKLKAGNYVLSSDEAAVVQRQLDAQRVATERQLAHDAETFTKQQRQLANVNARAVVSDRTLNQLQGKLVKLRGDEVVPYDASELKHVRMFAIYSSAHWCAPCRAFTPKLVEFYRRIKPQHPEFEVIFLSSDRDEFNMANYMRSSGMPWPAMRFGSGGPIAQQYCGDSIPWLVVVNDEGKPLTQNGIDKKYISADAVLDATEARLKEIKK